MKLSALILCLIYCIIPHISCRLLGLPSTWPRRFLYLATRSIGADIRVIGEPRYKNIFFIANHVSWLDILAMGGITGTAFIAHDGVAEWPVVGWLAKQNNTIFVSRSDRNAVRDQINAMHHALKQEQPLTLFPEGTTGNGDTLLPFKPALLAGLMPPPRDLDIQPVYIDYGTALFDILWAEDESFGANATRIINRSEKIMITLHFLAPFDPEDYPDRKAVTEEARNRILARQAASLTPPPSV